MIDNKTVDTFVSNALQYIAIECVDARSAGFTNVQIASAYDRIADVLRLDARARRQEPDAL